MSFVGLSTSRGMLRGDKRDAIIAHLTDYRPSEPNVFARA